MAVLWCGGEDIDFSLGGSTPVVSTVTTNFRSTFARCAVGPGTAVAGTIIRSNPFPGGAVTSCWVSLRYIWTLSTAVANANLMFGLTAQGQTKGLYVGGSTANNTVLALSKYNGTTVTQLATEAGASLNNGTASVNRIDIQVINYGVSATVNVYVSGGLQISFTGDISETGLTGFDTLISISSSQGVTVYGWLISEAMVADEDLRSWPGLQTLALTGAGTTDQWTGTYSDINGTTFSDAFPIYTNTSAQDEQFNVTDLVAGVYSIKAVRIAARSTRSSGSTPTKIAFGYNSGGTVAVGPAQTASTGYTTLEELDSLNPVTGLPFQQSQMNSLQLNARSAT